MDVKYTFRDLIVYLLTGFFCSFMINLSHPDLLKKFLELEYLKGKDVTLLVIAIPILYIFGHIIQIIDLLFSFYLVNILKKLKNGNRFSRSIYKLFYKFFANTTAEYHREKVLLKRGEISRLFGYVRTENTEEKVCLTEDEHIIQKFAVMTHDKNNNAGYYYLLKELFSGIKSFLIIYVIYTACNQQWLIFICSITLLALVWIRAYNSSNNYIWSLTNTFGSLKKDGVIK